MTEEQTPTETEEEQNTYSINEMEQDIANINKLYNVIDAYAARLHINKNGKQLIKGVRDDKIILTKKQHINEMYNDKFYKDEKNNAKLTQLKQFKGIVDKVKNNYQELSDDKKDFIENYIKKENPDLEFGDLLNSFYNFYTNNKIDNYKTLDEKNKDITTTIDDMEKQSEQDKQQLAKQQQEIAAKKQEIEQQAKQHQQELKDRDEQHQQDIAERNRIENERAANIKHKALEEGKEEGKKMTAEEIRKMLEEDRRMQTEINNAQKDYINSKIYDGIYKLPHDKIVEIVQKDIENGKISTDDPEKMADMIYLESVRYINKHKGAIAKLSKLQGYNPTQFGQLPPSIQEAVNDYVREKGEEDIIRKNRRYLLPKDLPRWERATLQHNVNPMLGRGAWSH